MFASHLHRVWLMFTLPLHLSTMGEVDTVRVSEDFLFQAHQREKKIVNVKKDSSLPAKASACRCVSVLAQEVRASPAFT